MKIKFTDANGDITVLEISSDYETNLIVDVDTDLGTFYQETQIAEKSNDRKNARADRHTLLSTFDYEDARYFSDGTDLLADLIDADVISHALSCLNERQQYLIRKCFLEGWSYSDLAKIEDKDESAIRHAVDRAKKKLQKFLR